MTVHIATWKRPLVWSLGAEASVWQWGLVLLLALVLLVSSTIAISYRIYPHDWEITRPWPLPAFLNKDFVLVGESALSATLVDPVVLDQAHETEATFWSKAALRSEHFLYSTRVRGDPEILWLQFQAKNPAEVQPLAWEVAIRPFGTGDWKGKYVPVDFIANRTAWTLQVRYNFQGSPLLYLLALMGGLLVAGIFWGSYTCVLRPAHLKIAKIIAQSG